MYDCLHDVLKVFVIQVSVRMIQLEFPADLLYSVWVLQIHEYKHVKVIQRVWTSVCYQKCLGSIVSEVEEFPCIV